MTQAKVLTQEEVERVLRYLGKKQHAARNQAMFLLTHGCGVRIKELVSIRICDVLDRTGNINAEVHLNRNQTKGDRGRTVYLSDKMREVIKDYLCERFGLQNLLAVTMTDTTRALFANQKNPNRGFSPSTGCQMFHYWYKDCGMGVSGILCKRGGHQISEMRSPNSMVNRVRAAFQSRMGIDHFRLMLRSAR